MLIIHEEAWASAIETLKLYANGKVPCRDRQRPAFEALSKIAPLHPEAIQGVKYSPQQKECKNANKSDLS